MLSRIAARWWLTLVCAFPVAFLGLLSAAYVNHNTEPMYAGRTTVMESVGPPVQGQSDYYKMRLANLGNLATSQRVLSNAANTLSELGMKYSPRQILMSTSVTPVRDTNTLAIEVTLPDAQEAKISADVIAAELKKAYADQNNASARENRKSIQAQIENTRKALIQAQEAHNRYKQRNGAKLSAKDENLAVLAVDLKTAADTYSRMRSKLDEAKIRELQSRSEAALKTIDPAYVYMVDRHQGAKLLTGLVAGLVGGVILGLVVAASMPTNSKESGIAK